MQDLSELARFVRSVETGSQIVCWIVKLNPPCTKESWIIVETRKELYSWKSITSSPTNQEQNLSIVFDERRTTEIDGKKKLLPISYGILLIILTLIHYAYIIDDVEWTEVNDVEMCAMRSLMEITMYFLSFRYISTLVWERSCGPNCTLTTRTQDVYNNISEVYNIDFPWDNDTK